MVFGMEEYMVNGNIEGGGGNTRNRLRQTCQRGRSHFRFSASTQHD